jgi:hypothetical protein
MINIRVYKNLDIGMNCLAIIMFGICGLIFLSLDDILPTIICFMLILSLFIFLIITITEK